jgi:hypothetical protein
MEENRSNLKRTKPTLLPIRSSKRTKPTLLPHRQQAGFSISEPDYTQIRDISLQGPVQFGGGQSLADEIAEAMREEPMEYEIDEEEDL